LNLTVDNLDIGGKDCGFIMLLENSGGNTIFVVKIELVNDTWEFCLVFFACSRKNDFAFIILV